eukprot:m.483316 g.483316  ORF g.483316 m.483316 type:complete len:378 (-) comp22891_c0_seq1:135-1268(-)
MTDPEALRMKLREERKTLKLLKRPIATLHLFCLEVLHLIALGLQWLVARKITIGVALASLAGLFFILERFDTELYYETQDKINIAVYWIFLGFLSSFGLGTGLHTFVLYLGPHIAHVTMAAYDCNSTDFLPPFHAARPSTWYNIRCATVNPDGDMSILTVISKVQYAAIMWGFGTAVGELPPYFMARAARLSGEDPDDEDLEEFHESLKDDSQQIISRAKRAIHNLVNSLGFWGILLCASIPNPLFDLAGISCGHFLVPFSTFFGATLIGKGVFKMHLQMVAVVLALSDDVFDALLTAVRRFPVLGETLFSLVRAQRDKAKNAFTSDAPEEPKANIFSMLFGLFIASMVAYFAWSIVEHLAQQHQQRKDKARLKQKE